MKRFLGKCIEYAFVALLFVGLFFGLRYGVNHFVGTERCVHTPTCF